MNRRLGLSRAQTLSCLAQGAVLWFAAALLVRWLGPMGIYQDPLRALVYLIVIPGTLPFVLMLERLAGLARSQLFTGVAVATMAAILLDGLALAWFPGLYGDSAKLLAGAGAIILWGGGVGMALAWWRTRAP